MEHLQQSPIVWYLLLHSRDRFHEKFHRYPGESTREELSTERDATDLFDIVKQVLQQVSVPYESIQSFLTENHCREIIRFSNTELHVVSALLGGVAAQEAVKIITGQFIPMKSTYVYTGHGGFSAVINV